jgi:hypothetical protein
VNDEAKWILEDLELRSYRSRVEGLSQKLTRDLGTIFWKNVRCAQLHSQLPELLITLLELSAMGGSGLGEELLTESEESKVVRGELTEEEDEQIAQRLLRKRRLFDKLISGDHSFQDEVLRRVQTRLRAIEGMDDLPGALTSIGPSSLIQLWSAFEFLSAELWSKAIDSRPSSLGIAAAEWALPRVSTDGARRQLGRAFSERAFKTGKFLRARLSFSNATEIKNNYESIFLGLAFGESWVPAVKRIQATRNVLLHNGGVVNKQFRRLADIPLPEGMSLKFDGSLLLALTKITLEIGISLLEVVDSWLSSHTESSASATTVH